MGLVVKELQGLGFVDRVLVVDNNSLDRTAENAQKEGAVVIREEKPGYGHAVKRGLDAAGEDLLILTEADLTFSVRDIERLLSRIDEADLVVGSRTNPRMIGPGANMGLLLRWGNVAMGKLLQILYGACGFTDVGCTLRLMRREKYKRIEPYLTSGGTALSPEIMVEAAKAGMRVVEIPVFYGGRKTGESKNTPGMARALRNGLGMMGLIIRKRFEGRL